MGWTHRLTRTGHASDDGPSWYGAVRAIEDRSGARTNAARDRDTQPIPDTCAGADHRLVLTTVRRLVPLLLAGLLLVPFAGPAAAAVAPTADPVLTQAGLDLVTMTNRQRTALGLVALQIDPDLMAVARDRANVMAATDVMSHVESDGRNVFDRLNDAGLTWYGAGEIITWNHYPVEYSTAEAIRAWMASAGHHAIMVSNGYNYVGFGAAVSASGKRYYAGVFVKEPDETGSWSKFRTVTTRTIDAGHKRVTIRWSGGDTRLQVLTAGLRYFQLQWRHAGGEWRSWGTTTATSRSVRWTHGKRYEVRVRARDRAGNWGSWHTIRVRP